MPTPKPDYDAEFEQAIEKWRGQYKIREDNTVLLLLELFRIHQDHWDAIRQQYTMGYLEFRRMIETQNANIKAFQSQVRDVTVRLRVWRTLKNSRLSWKASALPPLLLR